MHQLRRAFGACLACLLALGLHAQTSQPAMKFDGRKGLVIEKDSTFRMTIRFRMQNRFALLSEDGNDLEPTASDIRIRRMRLRFDGFVLSPKLQYKIQLGFSKADLDLVETSTAQPIRDAVVYYAPDEHWSLGVGQTKLPGNRQRVVSSGALQLPDRSIVNGLFTLDRDMGFFANWTQRSEHQVIMVKTAITTGEGRNANPNDEGLCYTGRVEWLPLGEFTNEGDYFEGDVEREPKPKVSVAAGYSTNQNARRAGGQLGEFFPGTDERTLNVFIADALFKHKGWALSSEYCQRDVEGDPLVADEGEEVLAYEGWGWNTQLSRMVGGKGYEVVGRYSLVRPGKRIAEIQTVREEAWLGCTRYINHHRVKVQGALSYAWRNGQAAFDQPNTRWGLWFQMELGI